MALLALAFALLVAACGSQPAADSAAWASIEALAYAVTRSAPPLIERMVRRFDARFRELR